MTAAQKPTRKSQRAENYCTTETRAARELSQFDLRRNTSKHSLAKASRIRKSPRAFNIISTKESKVATAGTGRSSVCRKNLARAELERGHARRACHSESRTTSREVSKQ